MRLEPGDLYLTPGRSIFEVVSCDTLRDGTELLTFNIAYSPVPTYKGLVNYHGDSEIGTIMRCLKYIGHKNRDLGRLLYG